MPHPAPVVAARRRDQLQILFRLRLREQHPQRRLAELADVLGRDLDQLALALWLWPAPAPDLLGEDMAALRAAGRGVEHGEAFRALPQLEIRPLGLALERPLTRRIRQVVAQDIADVVAFMASDDARWITGRTILADGGLT